MESLRVDGRGTSSNAASTSSLRKSVRGGPLPPKPETHELEGGDVYYGAWVDGQPHGYGTYTWTDGRRFEGTWKHGVKHGVGTYRWPSDSCYTGEWFEGYMHGLGTFSNPDGTWYKGGFEYDLKSGLGKRKYPEGDTYEGMWKAGKAHGPGRYVWKDQNQYDGEWKAGKMHGRGTFIWATQERYDGEWADGKEHGIGIFTWKDGSTLDGFWKNGRKHGLAVFRTAPKKVQQEEAKPDKKPAGSESVMHSRPSEITPSQSAVSSEITDDSHAVSGRPVSTRGARMTRNEQAVVRPEVMILREYKNGKLLRSEPLSHAEVDKLQTYMGRTRRLVRPFPRDVGMGVQRVIGTEMHKGHGCYALMLNLQLGIRWSVGRMSLERTQQLKPGMAPTELSDAHFAEVVKQAFPRGGSTVTPPHPAQDFWWKDYSPAVFRQLRQSFGIDEAGYMLSLCGSRGLRQKGTDGKSGALFFISHENAFFVKTLRRGEVRVLRELLPLYARHVALHPHTLLPRFYGLHRIKRPGRSVYFVVTANVFSGKCEMHEVYDLKGSTHGRSVRATPDAGGILKDLDITHRYRLEPGWRERFVTQLEADCALLEELRIMDYSLLLGVHSVRQSSAEGSQIRSPSPPTSPTGRDISGGEEEDSSEMVARFAETIQDLHLDEQRAHDLVQLVKLCMLSNAQDHAKAKRRTTAVLATRQASCGLGAVTSSPDELGYKLGHSCVELGSGMPATAVLRKSAARTATPAGQGGGMGDPDAVRDPQLSASENKLASGESVVLYFAVIDILQGYTLRKKLEHGVKSIAHDSKAISAVNPVAYSDRFQNFMRKLFL